jgi:hypothetical protein
VPSGAGDYWAYNGNQPVYRYNSSSRGYAEIELILIICKQMGYWIHAGLVRRGYVPFLAPWAAIDPRSRGGLTTL